MSKTFNQLLDEKLLQVQGMKLEEGIKLILRAFADQLDEPNKHENLLDVPSKFNELRRTCYDQISDKIQEK